jgi:hypothetical protein
MQNREVFNNLAKKLEDKYLTQNEIISLQNYAVFNEINFQ